MWVWVPASRAATEKRRKNWLRRLGFACTRQIPTARRGRRLKRESIGVVKGNWGDVCLSLLVISELFSSLYTLYCFPPHQNNTNNSAPELPAESPTRKAIRTTFLLLLPNGFCGLRRLAATPAGHEKVSGQGGLLTSDW